MSDPSSELAARVPETAPKDKKAEKAERLEQHKAKVEAARKRVEDASTPDDQKDKEGIALFEGVKDGFKKAGEDPKNAAPEIGMVVYTYNTALEAAKNINDPAELRKAINALKTYHDQMGLDEYKVTGVEIKEEELAQKEQELRTQLEVEYSWMSNQNDRNERVTKEIGNLREKETRRLVVEKVTSDIANMPEQYAQKKLQPYYERMALQEEAEGEISSSLPPVEDSPASNPHDGVEKGRKVYDSGLKVADLPPRDKNRLRAFNIKKAEDRIRVAENQISDYFIDDDDIKNEVVQLREAREAGNVQDILTPWEERDEKEKRRTIIQRNKSFREQVKQSVGDKGLEAYDALSGQEKRRILEGVISREINAQNTYDAIDQSLSTGNASEICDRLNEAKQARRDVKDFIAQTEIRIAAQKSENAVDRFLKKTREFGMGRKHKPGEIADVINLGVEAATSWAEGKFEPVKQAVIKAAEDAKDRKENASEKMVESYTKVANAIHENVGIHLESVSPAMKVVSEEAKAGAKAVVPWLERKRMDMEAWLYKKKGAVQKEFYRSTKILAAEASTKWSMDVRRKIGETVEKVTGRQVFTEEDKKAMDEKRERLDSSWSRLVERIDQEAERRHQKSPGEEYFWKEVMSYVDGVKGEVEGEEVAPEVVVATPSTDTETSAASTHRAESEPPHTDGEADKTSKANTGDKDKKTTEERTKGDDWQPEGDDPKEMWKNIKDLDGKADRAKDEDKEPSVKEWGFALLDSNEYLNKRLSLIETPKTAGNKDYDRYLDLSREMADIYKELKDKEGLMSVDEQEARFIRFQKLLKQKWQIFDNLKKAKT